MVKSNSLDDLHETMYFTIYRQTPYTDEPDRSMDNDNYSDLGKGEMHCLISHNLTEQGHFCNLRSSMHTLYWFCAAFMGQTIFGRHLYF